MRMYVRRVNEFYIMFTIFTPVKYSFIFGAEFRFYLCNLLIFRNLLLMLHCYLLVIYYNFISFRRIRR